MARCDQGYICDVCGREVEEITESDLYLRYVLGEILPDRLHIHPERHIPCNPALAQYIVDERFPAVICEGPFSKSEVDAAWVASEEKRVTRAWQRLQEIPSLGIRIEDYPLPPQRDSG